MIDFVTYFVTLVFSTICGIFIGIIIMLPEQKELPSDIYMKYKEVGGHVTDFTVFNEKIDNSSAYLDMDEWKKCIDECPYYIYESKPKKKKRKK